MDMRANKEYTGSLEYAAFLARLLRNYLFGSMIAVIGVGGSLVFFTLVVTKREAALLGGIMLVSMLIMIGLELFVFFRHIRPIRQALLQPAPSSGELAAAYLQTHRFPILAVKRTMLPHFMGLIVPAVALALLFIQAGWLNLPLFYVGLAFGVALMVASMHAMIEFYLTSRAIRPIIAFIRNRHLQRFGKDLTLGGQVLVSIRTKFRLSAFLIGALPMLLFSLTAQIRLDRIHIEAAAGYWTWSLVIFVIGIAFSVFGASLLSRNIEAPIQTIQEAMGSVEGGNFDVRADDVYADEFSKLVAGFNHMVTGLKEREQRNAQLLSSYFMTLAAALDARDAYTAGHSTRVADYSLQIGRLAGWSEPQLELLYKTALLHDIGKIGVRDAVLLKEGRLTDEEFEQIKKHPVLGENILKQIEPVDAMSDLLPGVRSHHERYDGKGYPDGLIGEDIPMIGRAIAIADAFDAMTSDRPYRLGMPEERALAILSEGRGTQWDPLLTELFVRERSLNNRNPAAASS